jgi:hypothetical protein
MFSKHLLVLGLYWFGFGYILFSGPFKGFAAGVTIACQTILHQLHPGERIWGDKAYTADFRVIIPTRGKWKYMHPLTRFRNKKIYRTRQIVERSILQVKHHSKITSCWFYSFNLHQKVMFAAVNLMNFKLKTHPLN